MTREDENRKLISKHAKKFSETDSEIEKIKKDILFVEVILTITNILLLIHMLR